MIRLTAMALLIVLNATASDRAVLALRLTAPAKIKAGAKIVVEVATTNESNQVVSYHNTNLCNYSVTVRTGSGAPPPETSLKKHLDCSSGEFAITGRNIVVTLKPGESKSEGTRYLDIRENDELDEDQFIAWIAQASRLPGRRM